MTDQVYDAWKIKPPCETSQGCKKQCPYFSECNQDESDDENDSSEDEEKWQEYINNQNVYIDGYGYNT